MTAYLASVRRSSRLTKEWEFRRVQQKGKSRADRLLVVKVLANELGHNRWGILITKRVGKAVVRNLIKRRLRELLRSIPMNQGWDGVIIARPLAASASFAALDTSLRTSFGKLGIFPPK